MGNQCHPNVNLNDPCCFSPKGFQANGRIDYLYKIQIESAFMLSIKLVLWQLAFIQP